MTVSYLLPIRRSVAEAADAELWDYLRRLAAETEVVVVDGSPADVFATHASALGGEVVHVAPDPARRCANGKAWGVISGLEVAAGDAVIVADDDVRWTRLGRQRALALLDGCDLVLPQNVFSPSRWHTVWDTARILLNRAVGHDWPGTLVLRRAALRRRPVYDGDVLFENCELVRTVVADGGRVCFADDLFVGRRPPTFRQFAGQRSRQAYDDLAQPGRMLAFLAVGPAVALGRRRALLALAGASVALAETGRRRHHGATVFAASSSLLAPLWLLERSVLAWWALWRWVCGQGVVYGGRRLTVAAHSVRELRRA